MQETLTLEEIAQENDIILLDTNTIGGSEKEIGGNKTRFDLLKVPIENIRDIANILSERYRTILEYPKICTIKEVIKECDVMTEVYDILAYISIQKNSTESRERTKQIMRCNSLFKKSLSLLREREIYQTNPSTYYPLIAMTLEAANLMPKFSTYKKHFLKSKPSVITDELLVANAFALSTAKDNKMRVGVVSYDSRIEPLIAGTYSLLLAKQLFPQNADFGDRILDTPIYSYGIRRRVTRKAGEFFEHDVLKLVRDDLEVGKDKKFYRLIQNFIEEVERFNPKVA